MSGTAEVRIEDLMAKIAELAARRRHRLAPDMVNGRRVLTVPAALMTIQHLKGCAVIAPAADDDPPEARQETEQAARTSRPGRRPGPMISEAGIYYYEDTIYKVIKSQYTDHFQARRLDRMTGKFVYAPGMMGVLRPEDKMTPEQSIRYEELYGDPVCTDCGQVLENDLSRERRVGPKCWVKNGH